MLRPSYVLAKELMCYKRGAANLYPEYPLDFQTEIGDVGWIGTDGQFIRLVNCFQDGHRNTSGLPPNFVPLHIPEEDIADIEEDLRPGELLCSPGAILTEISTDPETPAQSSTIPPCNPSIMQSPQGIVPSYPVTVQIPREKGAFMMSQYPGRRRYIKPTNDLVHPYIISHRENWHKLSAEQFHILHKDDFIFISGQVETNQWAIGVSQQKDSVFTLRGKIGDRPARFSNPLPNNDCEARAGPGRLYMRYALGEDSMINPIQDQSIFLNFLKARTRLFAPAKIFATAGPHPLPDNHDRNNTPNMTSFIDPALQYILEATTCDVAIAGDIEIYHLLKDREWPDDLLQFLRDLSPKIMCKVASGISYGHFAMDTGDVDIPEGNLSCESKLPSNLAKSDPSVELNVQSGCFVHRCSESESFSAYRHSSVPEVVVIC
ncbi:hypothetical protein QCA50_010106 [Cerrena zonata]|uniref:Uncharacterized protein n=1 Tax=Cerrena zonata TaxID=2478898 RepID=A0AAW0G969_9APHY